jgi:hypothetical protein
MRNIYSAALLLALVSAPVLAEDGSSSSSVRWHDGVGEVVMRGQAGVSDLNGEKVELKDGVVYVNGQSFGKVPKHAEVRYVVSGTSRTLYVDGKARTPLAKK